MNVGVNQINFNIFSLKKKPTLPQIGNVFLGFLMLDTPPPPPPPPPGIYLLLQ